MHNKFFFSVALLLSISALQAMENDGKLNTIIKMAQEDEEGKAQNRTIHFMEAFMIVARANEPKTEITPNKISLSATNAAVSEKQRNAFSEQLKTLNSILDYANDAKKWLEADPYSAETRYILNNHFRMIAATTKYLSISDLYVEKTE